MEAKIKYFPCIIDSRMVVNLPMLTVQASVIPNNKFNHSKVLIKIRKKIILESWLLFTFNN